MPRRKPAPAAPSTDQPAFATSAELRAYLRAESPRILLSFSGGKDAIASWCALKADGFEIVPYHLELIPGLVFIDDQMRYFEAHFGTPILRFPHPSLWRWLRNLVFQPPERCAAIEATPLPRTSYESIEARVRELHGDHFVARGTRAADSPMRQMHFRRNGAVNWRRRIADVIYDWRLNDVETAIRREGVRLPVDYAWFGLSFDGLDARFLGPLREHAPEDYRRVLEIFPLADLDLFRRTLGGTHA